jgi:hypothetical protein
MLWIDHLAHHYRLTLNQGLPNYLDTGQQPTTDSWQHLAATYDGNTARFYIDGTQVATAPFTGNVGDSNSWQIGAYGDTLTGYFNGLIDEVRIYNYALDATHIHTDMTTPITPGA